MTGGTFGTGTYTYDANGNLATAPNGRTATWTSFDMPLTLTKGSNTATFTYGPEHQRTKQIRSGNITVTYAGAMEVETNTSTNTRTIKTYWPMGIGVEIDRPATGSPAVTPPTQLNWLHKDRLGSPIAISGETGALRERLAYDAWGKRRTTNGAVTGTPATPTPDTIDGVVDNRGFTGHEMLDQLDLVHMNGRIYDPLIGRFLSADPILQDPMNGQSYNRYSYVMNNPTNFTDPTGFSRIESAAAEKWEKQLTTLLAGMNEATRSVAMGMVSEKLGGLPGVVKSIIGGVNSLLSSRNTVTTNGSEKTDPKSGGAGKANSTGFHPSQCVSIACNSKTYGKMDAQLSSMPGPTRSDWFGVASDTTNWYRVGLADKPTINFGFFTDNEEEYLRFVSLRLAPTNYQTFDTLVRGKLPEGVEGSGRQLDYALVDKEQRLVSQMTNSYFAGNSALRQEVMSGLNKAFDHNSYRGTYMEALDASMFKALQTAFGKTQFDFANEEHRRRLGYALVDLKREERGR